VEAFSGRHDDGEEELDTQKIANFFFLLYYIAWDEGTIGASSDVV
jgi:hypothetical protein